MADEEIIEAAPAEETTETPKSVSSSIDKAFDAAKVSDKDFEENPEYDAYGDDEDEDEEKPEAKAKPIKDEGEEKPEKPEKKAAKDNSEKINKLLEDADDEDADQEGDEDEDDDEEEEGGNRAPDRFSEDAKKDWEAAPASVRGEVSRAIRELEGGIEKYRGEAEAYEEFREFHSVLQGNGQKFQDVLGHYVGIEQLLAKNPIEGMDRIAKNMGLSIEQISAHVMRQPLDQRTQKYIGQMSQMQGTIQNLTTQLQTLQGHIDKRAYSEAQNELNEFTKLHPKMNDSKFVEEVSFFYTSGKADTLEDAYEMAERQLGSTSPSPRNKSSDEPRQSAQTRGRSLNGTPKSGSYPSKKGSVPSTGEALERRLRQMGV